MKFKHYKKYNFKGLGLENVDVNECGCILGGNYIPIMCPTHNTMFERINSDKALAEQALFKLYKEINVIRDATKVLIASKPRKKKEVKES